jgi:hypothetical protein
MPFTPFTQSEFQAMQSVAAGTYPPGLAQKIDDLRRELGTFPEFELDFFRKRIVRRPNMRGDQGLVFGPPRWTTGHWFLFVVGGDQDQAQLNIGMWADYIRVGLGFQIGRQVSPKIPAFQIFQTFLGVRPPLPFRDAFYQAVKRNAFQIEDQPSGTPDDVLYRLETYVIPADRDPVFVFIGALWDPPTAANKNAGDFRGVFQELLPFYEELMLAGGRYTFCQP